MPWRFGMSELAGLRPPADLCLAVHRRSAVRRARGVRGLDDAERLVLRRSQLDLPTLSER